MEGQHRECLDDGAAGRGDTSEPDSTLQSAIRLVAGYIPAEAIVVYIAILGLLNPNADASADDVRVIRAIAVVIGILVAVGLAFVAFKGGALTKKEQRRREVIVAAMAGVSFLIYAAAMPSFFFQSNLLTLPFSQWAAILAIITALTLPLIAKGLKLRK